MTQHQLHFIEQKLYITLKKQKILKFYINKKPQYFSFQMYQTIEKNISENND